MSGISIPQLRCSDSLGFWAPVNALDPEDASISAVHNPIFDLSPSFKSQPHSTFQVLICYFFKVQGYSLWVSQSLSYVFGKNSFAVLDFQEYKGEQETNI